MKKLLPLLLIPALLMGCSSEQSSVKTAKAENEPKQASPKEEKQRAKSLEDVYVPNPQVPDDTNLVKVGESLKDEKGEATLKEMAALHKTFQVGPIELKVKNVKVIHNVPSYSLMDYFHSFTEHHEEFDYVKVEVEMINHAEQPVHFAPVAQMKTSNGDEMTFADDFYIEYLSGELQGHGSKQGALGFIIEKPADELASLEFITGDVLDENEKKLAEPVKIKVDFN